MATAIQHEHSLQQRIMSGVVGGLAGGAVFGLMMGGMGMLAIGFAGYMLRKRMS